jgi:hypothetical protein
MWNPFYSLLNWIHRKYMRERLNAIVALDLTAHTKGLPVFVRGGRLQHCSGCGRQIGLPAVMIPERVTPRKGSLVSPDGYYYECEARYHLYHRGCAILKLMKPVDVDDFRPKATDNQPSDGDSNGKSD